MASNAEATTREERPGHDEGVSSRFSLGWKSLGFRGLLAVAIGIIAIFYPFSALLAFTTLFAVYALIDGALSIASAIRRIGDGRHWIAMLLRGLLGLAVGILFIAAPVTMTVTYAVVTLFIIAGWAVAAGALEIMAALRLRREIEGEWLLAFNGLLSIGLGVVIVILFLANPAISVLSVGWAIGAYALLSGIMLLGVAWKLRRRSQSPRA